MDIDANRLFESLGEIRATLKGLDEKVDDLKEQSNERHTENVSRIGSLEQNAREFQAASSLDRASIKRKLDETSERLGKVEKPVEDFVALRNRIGAWVGIITALALVIWFVIGPFWGVIEQKVIYWIFPGLKPPQ